ncbi:MAG: polysaccharide deacetylase family protein [Candidatus Aminicenantes bacterium]|nr:MAG: polysaccharide deacetylase family protein [Candidatus Aminicenantes bacterium]
MVRNKTKKTKIGKVLDNVRPQLLLSDLSHAASLERLGEKLFERIHWRALTDEPEIAITFDDGPHATSTPQILELLQQLNVPASFFLVGKHLEKYPEIACEMVGAGHEIGNHTFSHSLLYVSTRNRIRNEISRTDTLLRNIDGAEPKFFRPPAGFFTKQVLDIAGQLGYKTVVGDVYPRDPHLPGKKKIVDRVLQRTVAGSIIILHDGGNTQRVDRSQTLEALSEIIPILKRKGFKFKTLSDLLLDQTNS